MIPEAKIRKSRLANWWVRKMLQLKRWLEEEAK